MSAITELANQKLGDEPQPSENGQSPKSGILSGLMAKYSKILEAAASDIIWTPAWVHLDKTPIFSKGTINVVQGKTGTHKSRLAELFCALLLSVTHSVSKYCGFLKNRPGIGFYVAYIDTERNTQEHFPVAVQRIRELAGLDKKKDNGQFFPISIKHVDRKERLKAVKQWIQYVRGQMEESGVPDWGLFVVLDVVTDCVASFNNEVETLALFDYLGNLCEAHKVTFLLIIHENPFSEKARGHTGTEAMNKADTQMQISYESGNDGEESDLIKIRFLKTRNAERPKPLYLQYSKDVHGLVTADPETVDEHIKGRTKNNDLEPLIDTLIELFDNAEEVSQKEICNALHQAFTWSKNTAIRRADEVIDKQITILNKSGKKCNLVKVMTPGKPTIYRLEAHEPDNAPVDDEPPF